MIEKYKNLIGKNVVVAIPGRKIEGYWSDWLREEPSKESILIDTEDGSIIEIFKDEILSIKLAN